VRKKAEEGTVVVPVDVFPGDFSAVHRKTSQETRGAVPLIGGRLSL
jgi:hypothetical protein